MLRDQVSTHALSVEKLTSDLATEREAHAATSDNLADLVRILAQERKAWKADRAMLVCERDGAVSQVPCPSTFLPI